MTIRKNTNGRSIKRVLFFFPHNPYPPRSGAHIRCLEILNGLIKLNCEVFFISSAITSETNWNNEGVDFLKKMGIQEVMIYNGGFTDRFIIWIINHLYLCIHEIPPLTSFVHSPPLFRMWFKKNQSIIHPDIVWMNYSYWDRLITKKKENKPCLIIDYLDIVSRNQRMQKEISKYLLNVNSCVKLLNSDILNEDFFMNEKNMIDYKELKIIASYNIILAITLEERDLIRKVNPCANVHYIPVTYNPVNCNNSYNGSAIFVTGPNLFNFQGFFYFTNKVLPRILQKAPDFNLWVTGSCSTSVEPQEGISLLGYVTDLEKQYSFARFSLCPVLGGTGQQIKVIEAMAHGLAIVTSEYSARTAPVIHGINGFIAKNPEEFADYCIMLWQNPELCKKMGDAAFKTIQENFSEVFLQKKLQEVIDS
jgi:glycosyltransferase involved in cell wall biosynthesis